MAQQRRDGPDGGAPREDPPPEDERGDRDVTEQRVAVEGRDQRSRADGGAGAANRGAGVTEWFASTALRAALAVVGVVVLLFALGQLVGIDLLGLAAEALSSELGRWSLIAVFGLLLIGLAQRGFRSR
ncbi:hypothetical protein BRC77_08995 [Halobacteriales archaeon QH_8_64_26]|jgi:hypothetical protein|nr:MAG: hypothetical protein BRC77_08995 [Halobacteriales archaeon QH_8_64_26]